MEYWLVKEGNPGCDYSISCGTSVSKIGGATMDEAVKIVLGDVDEIIDELETGEIDDNDFHNAMVEECRLVYCYRSKDEGDILNAQILEVNDNLDLHEIIIKAQEKIKSVRESLKTKAVDNTDKAEYERLKKKFE